MGMLATLSGRDGQDLVTAHSADLATALVPFASDLVNGDSRRLVLVDQLCSAVEQLRPIAARKAATALGLNLTFSRAPDLI